MRRLGNAPGRVLECWDAPKAEVGGGISSFGKQGITTCGRSAGRSRCPRSYPEGWNAGTLLPELWRAWIQLIACTSMEKEREGATSSTYLGKQRAGSSFWGAERSRCPLPVPEALEQCWSGGKTLEKTAGLGFWGWNNSLEGTNPPGTGLSKIGPCFRPASPGCVRFQKEARSRALVPGSRGEQPTQTPDPSPGTPNPIPSSPASFSSPVWLSPVGPIHWRCFFLETEREGELCLQGSSRSFLQLLPPRQPHMSSRIIPHRILHLLFCVCLELNPSSRSHAPCATGLGTMGQVWG